MLADVATFVVAGGEQGDVGVEEPVGVLVTDDDAGLQCEQTRVFRRLVPDVGLTLGDVRLAEGEGHEAHVPVGSGLQRGHHVLVSGAGERAAVVERDGEGAGGHASANPRPGKKIPVDASPDLLRSHPQGDTDGRPGDHIGGVVDLHVDPAGGHDAREAVPEGLLGQRAAVGEQRRRRRTAAEAWPLGKLLVSGWRRECGRSPSCTGLVRLNRDLRPRLTSADSTPRVPESSRASAGEPPGSAALVNPARCQIRLWSPSADAM